MTSASSHLARRGVLKLLASSAGLVVLAACGSAALPAASPSSAALASAPAKPGAGTALVSAVPSASSAATKPSAQPKSGGTLRSAVVGDPPYLEVHVLLPSAYEAIWQVYDRLFMYDDKFVPQPMLAESWDISPDAKSFTFHLRKGVTYHSGREFTSDDVKYNLLRVRDVTVGAGTFANQSNWYTTIDTPDKYTAVLRSDTPRPLTFDFLEYFNMVDRETMQGPDAKSKAVGTGPFVFQEWVQGDHMSFTKNKNYWQSGKPYMDGLKLSILKDAQAMVAQLEASAVDFVKSPPLADFNRLRSDSRYVAMSHPNSGIFFGFGINVLNKPMDDKRVRQAINYSIDRKRFTDTVMYGIAKVQSLPWLPGSPAYDAAKDATYAAQDLDKAKSLLAAAGLTNLEFDLILTASNEGSSMAQILQSDLAKIGVKVNIKTLDSAVWLDQANNRKYNGAYWSTATRANLLPGTMLSSSKLSDPLNNNSGFKDDTYTQLITQATTESDTAKQKAIYAQLNDYLLDQSFFMAVFTDPPVMLAKNNLQNVVPLSFGGFGFTDAWLA